jgi:hypothetical protein
MKTHVKLFCGALLLFLIILTGCTQKPTVTDLWIDEAYDGKQYGKILVIGAAERITYRTLFEGELVKQLESQGVEAIPSYVFLPDNKKLTREIILSAIEKSDIDSVLITSLDKTSKRTVYYSIGGSNPYEYYNSIYNTIHGPGTGSYDIDILFLKTNLYDARSEKLIWSMTSESEIRYNFKFLSFAATLVINKLRDDNLI